MTVTLSAGRDVTTDLDAATRREWLVTNGLGGFACGTVAGLDTRRYHGLLVAALRPPLGRTLLLSALHERVEVGGSMYALGAARWADRTVAPRGFVHLDEFGLENSVPRWRFILGDAVLEKRVFMEDGANTTYVQYTVVECGSPVRIEIAALVNYRDYHGSTSGDGWQMGIDPISAGLRVTAFEGATPLYLTSSDGAWTAEHSWYAGVRLALEERRGLRAVEDRLRAGSLSTTLERGQGVTVVASTSADAATDGRAALGRRRARDLVLLERAAVREDDIRAPLVLAADQFLVRRPTERDPDGMSVIAGYPWFGDWGRDTMIALPGLTLHTGRAELAARVLETFAGFVDQGMVPNRFPDADDAPEYNTVDATLWYVEAIRDYTTTTGDLQLAKRLMPVLEDVVDWHCRGTRYGIRLHDDGLLAAGEPGVQLTWMDAKVGDWVVTPRIGKPVEINALWFNALASIVGMRRALGRPTERYEALRDRAHAGMQRFWSASLGHCVDVLDGPDGDERVLRPNQIFAVSLEHSALDRAQARSIVEVCGRELYTPLGLRSLARHEPGYQGRYAGGPRARDSAYHQGTVWSWLIGPFARAHLRVHGDRERTALLLRPLMMHLSDGCLGSVSEIFDGDPPFDPRGCFAQAWGVAELLRAWTAVTLPGA